MDTAVAVADRLRAVLPEGTLADRRRGARPLQPRRRRVGRLHPAARGRARALARGRRRDRADRRASWARGSCRAGRARVCPAAPTRCPNASSLSLERMTRVLAVDVAERYAVSRQGSSTTPCGPRGEERPLVPARPGEPGDQHDRRQRRHERRRHLLREVRRDARLRARHDGGARRRRGRAARPHDRQGRRPATT